MFWKEDIMNATVTSGAAQYVGKRTYTVEEISQILGIGRTSAYKLIHSGAFQIVKIGAAIRISKASFDEWLDKQ